MRAVGLGGNPTNTVSFIQAFEYITLNDYVFALIFHLTCETKKILPPLLLTSQDIESLEKRFFFLVCYYLLHFSPRSGGNSDGGNEAQGDREMEFHFSLQGKKQYVPIDLDVMSVCFSKRYACSRSSL